MIKSCSMLQYEIPRNHTVLIKAPVLIGLEV